VSRLRAIVALLICASASLAPRLAFACSVCSAGREDDTNRAFILTTIFLSVTPLLMFAGFGVFLFLRHRKRVRELAPSREPAAPRTPSLPELS
jgi:hypothetical protein